MNAHYLLSKYLYIVYKSRDERREYRVIFRSLIESYAINLMMCSIFIDSTDAPLE